MILKRKEVLIGSLILVILVAAFINYNYQTTPMLNNSNIDAESKKKAQDDMLALASVTDKEASCENLIKAKGFEECVVFVNGDTASVTVKSAGLVSSDLAKIQEIVSSQTGIVIKNIKIVEVK